MKKIGIFPIIAVIFIAAGAFLYLSKANNSTTQETAEVTEEIPYGNVILSAQGFSPKTITIKKGETVTWINQSGKSGTVNSDPHPAHDLNKFLNLGDFPNGSSVQAIFENAGTYQYHNNYSPQQTGIVVVK